MKTSINGINLIKQSEGLRLEAYRDIVGVWTIGYGSAIGISPGMKITEEEAISLLKRDLEKFEDTVSKLVKVPLNQNQFDALVCFCYNVGPASLRHSTLLKILNQGQPALAADEFLKWNKAGGKQVWGLTRRRQAERQLFLS